MGLGLGSGSGLGSARGRGLCNREEGGESVCVCVCVCVCLLLVRFVPPTLFRSGWRIPGELQQGGGGGLLRFGGKPLHPLSGNKEADSYGSVVNHCTPSVRMADLGLQQGGDFLRFGGKPLQRFGQDGGSRVATRRRILTVGGKSPKFSPLAPSALANTFFFLAGRRAQNHVFVSA